MPRKNNCRATTACCNQKEKLKYSFNVSITRTVIRSCLIKFVINKLEIMCSDSMQSARIEKDKHVTFLGMNKYLYCELGILFDVVL